MSILLTGGAGFIGSHTAVSLLNAGQDIVIVDNLYNSSPKVIDRIELITGKRPVFVEADCCDRAAMDRLFPTTTSPASSTLPDSRPSANPSKSRCSITATIWTPR